MRSVRCLGILIAAALLVASPAAAARTYGPYAATVERVIDGDTLDATVEIWPELTVRTRVRVAGIDTPELRAAAACERRIAAAARDAAAAWIAAGPVTLTLTGRDKYGRSLGRLTRGSDDLAAALIAAGHARPYDGGKRGSWCEDRKR